VEKFSHPKKISKKGYRICKKCNIELPLTTEYYQPRKGREDGFVGTCKPCRTKYLHDNKDHVYKRSRGYNKINKEKIFVVNKRYQDNNADHLREIHKEYRLVHKLDRLIYQQQRESKKKNLPSTLTIQQWDSVRLYFDNHCAYCNADEPLAQEHVVPIDSGGEYTRDNIICACISCNSSKGKKPFLSWFRSSQHYTPEREAKILNYLGYKNGVQQLSLV